MKQIIVFAILLFFYSCAPAVKFTNEKKAELPAENKNPAPEINLNKFNDFAVIETVTGIASYYAHDFHGKLTYNREVYDMYGLTAAHPTYPMDTILRVTNLSNNKTAVVRINDRMPEHPYRIIDLSYGTAVQIGMVTDGLTDVKLEVLQWGDE
ncbi:MAG: septal ring lytic transglycosylase RlpA family protein [Ignavibacteria bacterium]|jgi:rare lipoprotein A (peptidoglycan hydrolase)